MSNFNQSLKVGKTGEQIVQNWLESRGNQVTDVSDVLTYQSVDTDFVVKGLDNNIYGVEVKIDKNIKKTGNIFIEIGKNRMTGYYDGWASKCTADYLFYVDDEINKLVILNWRKAKEIDYKKHSRTTSYRDYTDNCIGYADLLRLDKAKELGLVNEFYLN